ncbi:FAD-dependent monooxygenase [Nonomuraea sp. NPDC050310]|uniref:FAD-dependent monooxygenase n=1 Tax=Nonomuraea sp. NPDC050310 TaxID=3154935 RepID=UPI0033CFBCAE
MKSILISGASVAGPVLAYWLARYGFDVTVVERAPALRKTGGHAVDLFRPAMEISERMGVLPRIEAAATGATRMSVVREGRRKAVDVDLGKIFQATSDRHVEIMRDDLAEIYYDAGKDHARYLFGDSITRIGPDGEAEFERSAPGRYDVIIGADGLHSTVRRLVFGEVPEHHVGGYLAVLSLPKDLAAAGEAHSRLHVGVNRAAALYTARTLPDARAVFLFNRPEPLDYHHRDVPRQKELLRQAFAGLNPEVDGWLARLDGDGAFYFDSITQLRLDSWSRGRVTLAGDAGYCPGPAVGGSTSLAVVGAYVLAGELAEAGGDHEAAFQAYERQVLPLVQASRKFALGAAKTLIPGSRAAVWGLVNGARVAAALPAGVSRTLAKLNSKGLRLHDSMPVRDYAAG